MGEEVDLNWNKPLLFCNGEPLSQSQPISLVDGEQEHKVEIDKEMPHTISCELGTLKKRTKSGRERKVRFSDLERWLHKKPRMPRKTKKFYKREYGRAWEVNYNIDKGFLSAGIKTVKGKFYDAKENNIHITPNELLGKKKGKWL